MNNKLITIIIILIIIICFILNTSIEQQKGYSVINFLNKSLPLYSYVVWTDDFVKYESGIYMFSDDPFIFEYLLINKE